MLNNDPLLIIALLAAVVAAVLLFPRRLDPAIRLKEATEPPQRTSPEDRQRKHDVAAINAGKCPDCGASGSLCEGQSGGMAQNIACDQCHMEFNVGFGFGTGAFLVDRTGRLSESRARRTFGFQDADFPPKVQP